MTGHATLANAYVCVRDIDAETGGPVLPNGWSASAEDAGWFSLRRTSDGLLVTAWRANAAGTRALWALFGPRSVLDAIAASEPACMPAREAWDRATGPDAEPAIRTWLRRWRHWRIDGHVRDSDGVAQPVTSAVVQLVPEGVAIPDPALVPLPWLLRADGSVTTVQAEAQVRVAAIHRPAMAHTMRSEVDGFDLAMRMEDEPERS